MKKLTKKDYFNQLLAIAEVSANETLVEFINHELELLAKKNSSERKPNATQKENLELKVVILENMEENRIYTITELIKNIDAISELTNQKVSAIVRQMVGEGTVVRIEEKKKAYFQKA